MSDHDEDRTQRLPKALVDFEKRLTDLEQKFTARGYDTRPMFEANENEIKQLKEESAKQADQIRQITQELNEVKSVKPGPELEYREWACFTTDGEGPYCPNCYEVRNIRRHLENSGPNPGQHWCTNCNRFFYEPGSRPRHNITTREALDID